MGKLTVNQLVLDFLAAVEVSSAANTHRWYACYLESFRDHAGQRRVADLTSSAVHAWIAKRYGERSASAQHGAARAVVRAINWGLEERLLAESPLRGFRKPPPGHREIVLSTGDYVRCLRASRPYFRDVLRFLWHTGCRPHEMRVAERRFWGGRKITLPLQQSKGKRRRRVIYLDSTAVRIVGRLADRRPVGPLFVNGRGRPWRKDALALAFRRLREETEIDGLCAYALRHTWTTRLLEKGVDVATVAAMAGNSPRMVLDHYNHVAANESRLLGLLE